MDVILFRTFIHVIIMARKVDSHTEKVVGILIKKSAIKMIDVHHDLGKGGLISSINYVKRSSFLNSNVCL
jgi:hypothetical protein